MNELSLAARAYVVETIGLCSTRSDLNGWRISLAVIKPLHCQSTFSIGVGSFNRQF